MFVMFRQISLNEILDHFGCDGRPVAFHILNPPSLSATYKGKVNRASIAIRCGRRASRQRSPRAVRLTAEDFGKDLSYEQDGSAARFRDRRDYGNRMAPSDRGRPSAKLSLPGSPLTRETRGDQE